MDVYELTDFVVFMTLLALLAILSNSRVRGLLVHWLAPVVQAAMARMQLGVPDDPMASVLWTARYRQQLIGHLIRVRRLVATDRAMSATRQIANRMALARLIADLEALPPDPPDLVLPVIVTTDPTTSSSPVHIATWDRTWLPAPAEPAVAGYAAWPTMRITGELSAEARSRSTVEFLDVGWGR